MAQGQDRCGSTPRSPANSHVSSVSRKPLETTQIDNRALDMGLIIDALHFVPSCAWASCAWAPTVAPFKICCKVYIAFCQEMHMMSRKCPAMPVLTKISAGKFRMLLPGIEPGSAPVQGGYETTMRQRHNFMWLQLFYLAE